VMQRWSRQDMIISISTIVGTIATDRSHTLAMVHNLSNNKKIKSRWVEVRSSRNIKIVNPPPEGLLHRS